MKYFIVRQIKYFKQVRLEDRAGQLYTVPDHWSVRRKLQLLDIHLQNWAQPALVPAFTRLGFEKRQVPADLLELLQSSLQTDLAVREGFKNSSSID